MEAGMGKRKLTTAWLGHRSYITSPQDVVYNSREAARKAGWKNPCKIRIEIMRKPTTKAAGEDGG